MDLLPRILEAAAGGCSFAPSDGAVVAVSGGPDSTALLDLLLRAVDRSRIVAAHLDHGIRADSAEEAAFVKERTREAGVRLVRRRVPVPSLPSRRGNGLEAAARGARYAFLEEVARDAGLPVVATGHHLDDQAETVLLRIVRGAGLRGLRGILPERPVAEGSPVRVVRPLLAVTRREILAYVAERGLPFLEDPTNVDASNLRSVLRTRVLPEITPHVRSLSDRLARVARRAADLYERVPRPPPRPRPAAPPDPVPPLGLESLRLPCPGNLVLLDGRTIAARPERDASTSPDRGREVVDPDAAPPPYVIRLARAGDRFRPLGLGAETAVLRFLKNQGVSSAERARTPVLLSGSRVVWVVGFRLDERAKVGTGTRRRVVLEVSPSRRTPRTPRSPRPS
ncbi:MAG: tRNA lysidine(34) synthetase TilS [Planctomycetota bacterium]